MPTHDQFQWLNRSFQKRPAILARFNREKTSSISCGRNKFSRFTAAFPVEQLTGIKPPAICFAEFEQDGRTFIMVGAITRASKVTTLEKRLTFCGFKKVAESNLSSFTGIEISDLYLENPDLPNENPFHNLRPSQSYSLVRQLSESHPDHFDSLIRLITPDKDVSAPVWQQRDAIKLSVQAFGLNSNEALQQENEQEVIEARLREDNVIWHDASQIPGFETLQREATGHITYLKGTERLDVYMANRGNLETMLGVDLIYINQTVGSTVMLQYKMLESASPGGDTDWIIRPDEQFTEERSRMMIPDTGTNPAGYRLNSTPFFFKFVRRKTGAVEPKSFIVSNDHLTQVLASEATQSPRGGCRISYESLEGHYLRSTSFVSLINSGYIGTHREETQLLQPIIEEVSRGNRGLVLAWQQRQQSG